ncbi:serine carboxypeptidase [Podospora didyma]|uniref:Serine carboxypeptidase n=1 Tax=Podospora didyma TaxID=330526 RepID=A0AAE0U418_9PEZI|nr:serine carboxypeptidase [Podospora didyma]
MHWSHAYSVLATAMPALAALNLKYLHPELAARQQLHYEQVATKGQQPPVEKRQTPRNLFLTDQTRKFAINGSALPEINFDVGESYAGLLPIEGNDTSNELFFWFFPSTNPAAQEAKEITIWLTGGPGCSSVGELLQENGPVLWQPGVFAPIPNKWSWHHLTNMVWIDQPIGSGFSHGNVTARNQQDVAKQFMGFWKNFVDTFALQGYKVYVTGSSYSGMYTPYISSAMLDANNTQYFDLSGMMIFDGLFSKNSLATDIPVASFVSQWKDIFAFNNSFSQQIEETSQRCGYADYLKKYLVFPPLGIQPADLPSQQPATDNAVDGCSLFIDVYLAMMELNPCFSVYEIADRCPLVRDPLGFSAGTLYVPDGAGTIYFDRADVKRAINAPANKTWEFCSTQPVFVDGLDTSVNSGPGSQPVIPRVIDATKNVLIGHGSQDFVLIADGTLLAIQNMTWGGQLGFQQRPIAPLYIPYHANEDFTSLTGAGVIGTVHSERGLTYFGVAPAGHFLTMDQPAVAFRGLEILLGRVENFQSTKAFTTERNATVQPNVAMGNGTVFAGFVETAGSFIVAGNNSVLSSTSTGTGAIPTSGAMGGRKQSGILAGGLLVMGLVAFLY